MDQFLTGEQVGILWRGFQLKGVDDDVPKKAKIAKKFKSMMVPGTIYIRQSDGSFKTVQDPRPEGKVFPEAATKLDLDEAEAKYLNECLSEICSHKDQGKPVVTAAMADEVEQLRDVILPSYWAKTPSTNGSDNK